MRNKQPDRIPVAPDISNMVPVRLTGKPFWDVYLYNDPPLHKAYLDALKRYKFDGGWEMTVGFGPSKEDKREFDNEVTHKDGRKIVVRHYITTPEGKLWEEITYWRDSPPVISRGLIKDFEKDFPIYLKYFFPDPRGCDDKEFQLWKQELGGLGVVSAWIPCPGLHVLVDVFDRGGEAVIYNYYDYSSLFDEYEEVCRDWAIKMTSRAIQAKPDIILTGGSGGLVFQTPDIFRKLELPTMKEITKLAKQNDIPSLVHSCGREKELVRICAEETDLSCINPLEIPPMGDCDLKQLKRTYGDKIALMGNLHTTDIMLKGKPDDVEKAAKGAIDDAGANGGYILSTGDQCPGDTPEENIYKLVEVAKTYGGY